MLVTMTIMPPKFTPTNCHVLGKTVLSKVMQPVVEKHLTVGRVTRKPYTATILLLLLLLLLLQERKAPTRPSAHSAEQNRLTTPWTSRSGMASKMKKKKERKEKGKRSYQHS